MNPDLEEFKILWKSYLKGQFTSLEDILLSIKHKEQEISDKLDSIPELKEKLSDYEDGIIKCPLCNKLEITVYGDDEYFPNLECNNCNMKWLCNGTGNDTLINEIEKYQTLKSGLEKIMKRNEAEMVNTEIEMNEIDTIELLEKINIYIKELLEQVKDSNKLDFSIE
mgnify:FL=1